MAIRVVLLAALAVSTHAGYLAGLRDEAAMKNRVVKTYQFPATALVGEGGMNPVLSSGNWSTIKGKEWGVCDKTMSTRDDGQGCSDSPGFGSGLTWNPCGEKVLCSAAAPPVLGQNVAAWCTSAGDW
jgi:hypothetical protein